MGDAGHRPVPDVRWIRQASSSGSVSVAGRAAPRAPRRSAVRSRRGRRATPQRPAGGRRATWSTVTPGCTWVRVSSQVSRVGLEHAEVGDDQHRAAAAQAQPLAVAGAVAEADRGDEVDPLDEACAGSAARPRSTSPAGGGDLRGAAGARQPDRRARVVADHRGVDVAEPVDLRRAEEADVDPARLEPVVEHLRHADDGVRGVGQLAVADRQRQPVRLGADACRTRRSARGRALRCGGPGSPRAGQPDADEAARARPPAPARRRRVIISSAVQPHWITASRATRRNAPGPG